MDFVTKILIALLIDIMLLGVPSFGDGKAFRGRDFSSLFPVLEDEQRAVILHLNGIQKMLIAVSLELEQEDNAIWIFPVLGSLDNVKIDVVDSFPEFGGRDPRVKARALITRVRTIALATQIYTAPLLMPTLGRVAERELFTIREKIEKWGIHAETVTIESIEGFANYLRNKEIGINEEELSVFQDYLSERYVLVIVWISSRKQLLEEFPRYGVEKRPHQGRWPCLYVEFATEHAFYPLRPTGSYGNEKIPIYLSVIGYVELDISDHFAKKFRVRHYKQESLPKSTPIELSKDLPAKQIGYTSIRFNGLAKELTEDLWFTPIKLRAMKYSETVVSMMEKRYIFSIFTICFILAVSYTSAGVTGLVLFRKWNGYAQLGLWNALTLFGLYIATREVKGHIGERLRNSGEKFGRCSFIFVFSILYVVITIILIYVLLVPL